MTNDVKELQKLVDDFWELRIKERSGATFLEIARCPHLENVWTNILAFYLNPNNEHNLFDLLLKAIFLTANTTVKLVNLKSIQVKTQFPTESGYIDIVVIADNFILGIENKVEANLYNDLADYSKTIDSLAKSQSLPTYKIVLSKYRNSVTDGFINIIYPDLIRTIKQNIGDFTDFSDTKYLVFLLDFLKNIENNINSQNMDNNLEVINFFHTNIDKVNKLIEYHEKLNADLINKLNNIDRYLDRGSIKDTLSKTGKVTNFIGAASDKTTGRFTFQGSQLIKYNVIINDISLFYQVAIQDYKIVSWYWFDKQKHQPLDKKLEDNGILPAKFEYDESDENIAKKIEEQIKRIIQVLESEA